LDLQVGSAAFGGNTLFSGGIYIHEGTLSVSSIGALGTNQVTTFDNGATLFSNLNVGGMVSVSQFKIGTGGALSGQAAGKTGFNNGVISNVSGQAGAMTFVGPGKSGMGGNNTFVGTVVIGNPATPLVPVTLSISRNANLGAAGNQISIGDGSTLMIEDGIDATQSVGSAALAGTFSTNRQINLTGSTAIISVTNTGDAINFNPAFGPGLNTLGAHVNVLTANGLITGPGQLVKTGAGTLVLTNTSNNFSGGTVINGGILSISNPAALGTAVDSLVINPTGVLQATASFSSSRAVTLGGTGGSLSGGTLDVTGSNIETRTGVIGGSGSLTKTGTGTLNLTAANTFTGDFYINGGTVSVSNNQSLGPQPPSLGSPLYTVHMANGTTLQTVTSSSAGNRQFEFVGGTVTFDVTNGFTQQRNGMIYGSGGLIKEGTGTLILTNANTYAGGMTINNGTLQVNNTSGSATGTGAVTVNGGGTLSGLPTAASPFNLAGSISGAVVVNGGGTLRAQSGFTLNLGSLTLNTSAISDFDLGALTATDVINITGTNGLSLAGSSKVNISNIGGVATGTYHLFDYTGTALSDISNLSLGSTEGGFTYSLSNNQTNTSIDLLVSTTSNQWANDASGSWSTAGNWTGGVPNTQGAQANFLGVINQARTVTVDGAFTGGSVTLNNASTYSLIGDGVAGHGLTFDNGGTSSIEVLAGSHIISASLSLTDNLHITAITDTALAINGPISENGIGQTVTTNGAGTITFGGNVANTYTGLTTVVAGTLNLNKTATINAIGSGGVQVVQGATLALLASDQIGDTATATVNGTFALGTSSETVGALGGVGSVTLGTGSLLTMGATNNLSSQFGGVISGTGTLTKAGTGTLALTGTNTFGGSGQTITINAGTLQVGADNNLGNVANSLTFNGGTLLFSNGFATTRNVTLNSGGGTVDTGNSAVTQASSGVINGTGTLTKTGTGTLILAGANTYSGGTILNAGKLSITSNGNAGTGSMQFNNGTTLVTNGSFNFTHGFVLGAPGGAIQADGLAVSAIIDVQSGTLTETTNGITDGGSGGRLMKIGAGTLDLQVGSAAYGGNTLFSGGIYIHEGTLSVSSIGALGTNQVTTFDNGATLFGNLNVGGVVSVS
ncbi:MAG: autotransporter-associated beta strand repeat-containing protein, partial [Akkermansiaceae bacterium]|nr:autotransporter-associated beta strand repeat-containing protein [Verrucomicrobiales bacterium]